MPTPHVTLEIDLGARVGTLRPLNGVNLGPLHTNGWLNSESRTADGRWAARRTGERGWQRALAAALILAGGIAIKAFGAYGNPEPKATQHEYSWRLGNQCQLDFPSGGHWFNLGPTGARAMIAITEPRVFVVKYIFPDSPAENKLHVEDRIIGVNGKKFREPEVFYTGYYGPRMELGKAIEESEGDPKLKGRLTFMVVREGKSIEVGVQLRPIGYFSRNFPFDCKKSEILIKDACEFLVKHKGAEPDGSFPGHWHTQVACTLALMAQGDTYMPLLRAHYKAQVAKNTVPGMGWNWSNALRLIELGEWYLITRDRSLIPLIKNEEKVLCETQAPNGGFQHGKYKEGAYGCMALPAGLACIGWALMKQGGIEIDKEHYLKSRTGLTWSTQPSGEIGYGIGMYTPDIPYAPSNYRPPSRFHVEDGRKTDSRGGGATSAATLMHYLDPMDACSDTYVRRGIVHMAACTDMMMDGHASAALQAQWGWMAVGLGTVVGDMKSYREMMDYWKYWFNVNRCHDGSFYFSPCIDAQVDPFSDIRYITTGSAILALSVPKHSLAILGRDPLIPGVDKSVLNQAGRHTYNSVRGGQVKTTVLMQSITSLKKSAKDQELAALDMMEAYVMRPVLSAAEGLEALAAGKDLYRLSEELAASDAKYKGIAAYDTRTAPLRAALAAAENKKLMGVGKTFYTHIVPLYETPAGKNEKKGLVLKTTREFIASAPDEPYLGKARELAAGLLAGLNDAVGEIMQLQKDGDVFLAARKLSEADREYGAFTNYVEKAVSLRDALAAPESKKRMVTGVAYYKLIDPPTTVGAAVLTRGQVLQGLEGFIAANGDAVPYGAMAREHRGKMMSELDTLVRGIEALQTEGDVVQAAKRLAEIDKAYGAFAGYAEKVRAVKAELNKQASKDLLKLGGQYVNLEEYVSKNPGEKAQRRVAAFVKAHAGTFYGDKATNLIVNSGTSE